MQTNQEILLGKVPGWRAVEQGNSGELLCHMAHSLRFFYGDGISFWVVFSQSF